MIASTTHQLHGVVAHLPVHLDLAQLQQDLAGGLVRDAAVRQQLQQRPGDPPAHDVLVQVLGRLGRLALLGGLLAGEG